MSQQADHLYEFGPFRLDAEERLLARDGAAVPLTPKAFDLLRALVERHGHLVTKEELFQAVWPDSFVEESNLSSNIALIRKALGDGENGLKFIETVPKRGYRFVAEVREASLVSDNDLVPEKAESQADPPPLASAPPKRASRRVRPVIFLAASVTVVFSVWAVWWSAFRSAPALLLPKIVPFTSFPGNEMQPTFSPDGNQIAFVWDGEKGDNQDIYVKQLGNESRLRLTTNPAAELWPCWSPDGRSIAFTREQTEGSGLYLIPSLGGAERRITQLSSVANFYFYQMSWSPDGEWLAVQDRSLPEEPPGIFLVARATGEKRKLTSPPAEAHADRSPAISPDGKTVAFVRFISSGVGDLYLVPTAGGETQRLTFDNTGAASPVWTPDSGEILFLRGGGSANSLWRVSATGEPPVQVEAAGRNLTSIAVSRQGRRLAWTQTINDLNIWRMELSGAMARGRKPSPPLSKLMKLLISSTRTDASPEFSPDGKRIVFASDRSGNSEIWVADSDGQHSVQLTAFNHGGVGSPHWSPDGRQVVFDARASGSADIYAISAEGGQPRRLTNDLAEDVVPSWSRDGHWIYFSSKRSGSPQIWRMPAAGGSAIQVTSQGGVDSMESPDGQFLYYTKVRYAPGIWRRPLAGGEETFVLDHHRAGYWRYWAIVEQGIYFATAERPEQPLIEFFSFATGQVTPVAVLEKGLHRATSGLAVSSDGRWLIWSQVDQVSSDIMLMENFR
jgi:Tol biopolymer transport system component/DNA-binding winged helix-turn-helix (wHTH) protein